VRGCNTVLAIGGGVRSTDPAPYHRTGLGFRRLGLMVQEIRVREIRVSGSGYVSLIETTRPYYRMYTCI